MAVARDRARVRFPGTTMETLTSFLSGQLGGPVVDASPSGKYDLEMYWTSGSSLHAGPPGAEPADLAGDPGPTLTEALRDQLGLRVESQKGPADFLFVDRAEKIPTEN